MRPTKLLSGSLALIAVLFAWPAYPGESSPNPNLAASESYTCDRISRLRSAEDDCHDRRLKQISKGWHLLLGSMNAVVSDQYSNFVGFQNSTNLSLLPTSDTNNTFSFTFGWQDKPILKDLYSWVYGYKALKSGSARDDLVLSAFTVTATMGATRGFEAKGGTLRSTVSTSPSYGLSFQYKLPIENLVGHMCWNWLHADGNTYVSDPIARYSFRPDTD